MNIGMATFTESIVENAALAWMEGLGYTVIHGPEIAARDAGRERRNMAIAR
jgi:type I restriction enzyme R subunit